MLQKELAKRLRGRFETEMDGDGWLAMSSEEYIGKIAEIQNELLTVKEYALLYEHTPQMKGRRFRNRRYQGGLT